MFAAPGNFPGVVSRLLVEAESHAGGSELTFLTSVAKRATLTSGHAGVSQLQGPLTSSGQRASHPRGSCRSGKHRGLWVVTPGPGMGFHLILGPRPALKEGRVLPVRKGVDLAAT